MLKWQLSETRESHRNLEPRLQPGRAPKLIGHVLLLSYDMDQRHSKPHYTFAMDSTHVLLPGDCTAFMSAAACCTDGDQAWMVRSRGLN